MLTLSYKYPLLALFAFVIYLPFAGTIIYYLGNSPILQLAKDGFFIPMAIAVWQTCKKQKQPFLIPKAIKTPFLILFGCCILTLLFINGGQQLNPSGGDIPIGVGILGLKVFLGYVPLITCIYYLIRNQDDFWWLSRIQIVLFIICCILGLIQYILLDVDPVAVYYWLCAGIIFKLPILDKQVIPEEPINTKGKKKLLHKN